MLTPEEEKAIKNKVEAARPKIESAARPCCAHPPKMHGRNGCAICRCPAKG